MWWVVDATDAAADLRTAAACLAAAGKGPDAVKALERAALILSDGPHGVPAASTARADAEAAWTAAYGDYANDPEVRAKVAAAHAALERLERERADDRARRTLERAARQTRAAALKRRRGRR
jgi:hypothetical protein